MRRVSVSPWSNFFRAVEITEGNSILNWRYSPSEVTFNFSKENVRKTIRERLKAAREVTVEIVLQDIETLNGSIDNIKTWLKVATEESLKY